MENVRNEPGRLIRAYRESRNLTLCQFGRQCGGVSKVTVHRWETGKRKPDQEFVPVISRVTGIPPGKLRPDLAFMFAVSAAPRRRTRPPPKSAVA